jgi:hypothetical protein
MNKKSLNNLLEFISKITSNCDYMKRTIAIIILILVLTINISYFYFSQDSSEQEEWEEITIDSDENSIYNGYKPSEIAENMAMALDVTPMISREQEKQCGGCTMYTFRYQNNTSIRITTITTSQKLWSPAGAPITISSDKETDFNVSSEPEKAAELFVRFWQKFVNNLGFDLEDKSYNFSITPHTYGAKKVTIRQNCNNIIPLLNTGLRSYLNDNSELGYISIYKWSNETIEKNVAVSLEESIEIVSEEIPEVQINRSLLNFTGYSYFNETVHYYFNYETIDMNYSFNTPRVRVESSLIDMNGTKIRDESYEQWVRLDLYVNIENGEFIYNHHGIHKLIT